ncbi:MAG: imidazolonepropionase, partial [Actinobacteria bacterium]|nr:imidazolonepropionase [Actinomycetota bacterium]
MTSTAFTNIRILVTNDPGLGDGPLGVISGAHVVVENGVIVSVSTKAPTGVDSE